MQLVESEPDLLTTSQQTEVSLVAMLDNNAVPMPATSGLVVGLKQLGQEDALAPL
jgi:hypothetical protein